MTAARIEELRLDIEELKRIATSAERQRVKDALSLDLRKMETDLIKLQELLTKEQEAKESKQTDSTCGASAASSSMSSSKCYDVKISNYAWDQSEKFVKIFVSLPNVHIIPKENVFCDFSNRSMILHVNSLENRNYQLPILNLLEDIDMQKSHWKVKTDNVIVYMAKANVGSKWSHVTGAEKQSKERKTPKVEPNTDDPSSSIMDLLKQMYEDGDDEMKRTIAKAWASNRDGNKTMDDMPSF